MKKNKTIFKNGIIYKNNLLQPNDIIVECGMIKGIGHNLDFDRDDTEVIDCTGKYILPGFSDVHVHFREPGYEYKETIKTGSMAALNGGYSHVCTMPNLNPVPDCVGHIDIQLDKIRTDAVVHIHPYGSITKGEKGENVSDIEALAPYVIGYSDDGFGVKEYDIMFEAMSRAAALNKPIAGHCEVKRLTGDGIIHDGKFAKANGFPGIPSASEFEEVKRNIEIAKKTDCHFHVCHASCKETIDLVRQAKLEGIKITCETAPQYLLLCDENMRDDGRYRFQPPLRTKEDKLALIGGLLDGTIDMVATDHAPHSEEEKNKGLKGSTNGIVGLECAFPLLYTYLVKEGIITLEDLLKLMINNPNEIFNIGSEIAVELPAEFNVWDLELLTKVDANKFETMGRYTPFDGYSVYGERQLTLMKGRRYDKKQ